MLTYKWQNFESVIEKAKVACANSGNDIAYHFTDVSKVIPGGRYGQQLVSDVNLTRYACYLIAQNADPKKEIVAQAQTYFAVQTRRQEVQDAHSAEIEEMIAQAKLRVETRERLSDSYNNLEARAAQQSMRGPRNFATLHNSGDLGMFSMGKDDLAERHGLQPQRGQRRVNVNDHLGTPMMGATIVRNTIGGADITQMHDPSNKEMFQANFDAGQEVRDMLLRHGVVPEGQPMEPHISETRKIAEGQIPLSMISQAETRQLEEPTGDDSAKNDT